MNSRRRQNLVTVTSIVAGLLVAFEPYSVALAVPIGATRSAIQSQEKVIKDGALRDGFVFGPDSSRSKRLRDANEAAGALKSREPASRFIKVEEKMTTFKRKVLVTTLAGAAGLGCLFINESTFLTGGQPLVSTANAIIGRPLTPLSDAGAARRATRRAIVAGAAVGAAAHGCTRIAGAYGAVYTRCY